MRRARRRRLCAVNVPVICAGQVVNAGGVIVADDDGVCVVRREDAGEVLARAQKREALEEEKRRRQAAGELGLDIHDMRGRLAEKGLRDV